jgi:glycosyltransferase involved in cell wall biosynthesis
VDALEKTRSSLTDAPAAAPANGDAAALGWPQPAPAEPAEVEVSCVMPCLDEAETLPVCIAKAKRGIAEVGLRGEIVVADNGSTDGSQEIARQLGARVVNVERPGYGAALMGGIEAAHGRYIVMADADDSYDFSVIAPFIERLEQGYDLVMGNRLRGRIEPGAMPALHRYLGTPVLSAIAKRIFRTASGDVNCGQRAFTKQAFQRLGLRATGMEFASEMIVKASVMGLRVAEVPITLYPDGRSRDPHLKTWRDGWRHLRLLLLYSPRWLFLYPGALLMLVGLALMAWIVPESRTIGPIELDLHTLLYGAAAIVVGFQAVSFAWLGQLFAVSEGLLPEGARSARLMRWTKLEVGVALGAVMILAGVGATVLAFVRWGSVHFGALDVTKTMRVVIPAVTLLILGGQLTLASFFASLLRLKHL